MDAQIHELTKVVEDTATALLQVVQLGLKVIKRRHRHLLNVQRLFRFHRFQMREPVLYRANTPAEARQFPFPLLDPLFFSPGFGRLLLHRILLFLLQPGLLFQFGQLFLCCLLFVGGVPKSGRGGRETLQRFQIFLNGTDFFLGALDQPWPIVFLVGSVRQLGPLLLQPMKLTFNMPALLCKVGLPRWLGLIFGIEPVKAFIGGYKQPGECLDGRLTVGVQVLAGARHHQPGVHRPQRRGSGLVQLVLKLPMLLAFPFLQGFQLALKLLLLFLDLFQTDLGLGGTLESSQVPFLAIEFLFLDVLDFLKGHLPVLGYQQIAIFLVLLGLLDATVGGTDLALQATGVLLQFFQSLEHMAQGLVLFIERLYCGFTPGANILQGMGDAIPESRKIMLAAKQGLVGLIIPLQLLEP